MSSPSDTFLPPHPPHSNRLGVLKSQQKLARLVTKETYTYWLGGLKLYLKNMDLEYVLTTPIPEVTEESPSAEMDAFFEHLNDSIKVTTLMISSMPIELQDMFKEDWAFNIYQKLREMFDGCLSQHDLDFMDDPNEVECIHCTRWGPFEEELPRIPSTVER